MVTDSIMSKVTSLPPKYVVGVVVGGIGIGLYLRKRKGSTTMSTAGTANTGAATDLTGLSGSSTGPYAGYTGGGSSDTTAPSNPTVASTDTQGSTGGTRDVPYSYDLPAVTPTDQGAQMMVANPQGNPATVDLSQTSYNPGDTGPTGTSYNGIPTDPHNPHSPNSPNYDGTYGYVFTQP